MPPGRPQDNWKGNAAPGRPATRGSKPTSSRRWLGAALILAALPGVIVGLFFYLRPDPEPVLLAFPVTQYTHNDWSPNPWAEADAHGIRERFSQDSAESFQNQEKARILRELNRAADDSRGKDKRRPVIVFLSALGTAVDGTPYIIPGDAKPDDSSGWITLDELLAPLRRTDADRLLILDIRPALSPRAVLPDADVNEAIEAALEKLSSANDLPFLVLTANNPCDGPNILRPMKRSVFGLAVAQGLAGAADNWNAGSTSDGRVTAKELAGYVREVTTTITALQGFTPQVPRWFGQVDDFRLFPMPNGGTPVPPGSPPSMDAEPYPPWLADTWQQRDKWNQELLNRRAPRLLYHLKGVTLRTEQRWLAGMDAKAVQDPFTPLIAELRETAKSLTPLAAPMRSVARVRGKADTTATEKAFAPLFSKIKDGAVSKPEDKGKLPAEITAAIAEARGKLMDGEPFDAASVALFDFALGLENPSHDQVRAIAAAANVFPLKQIEFTIIAMIATLPADHIARWPAGTTRKLLEVARAAEDAVVCDGRLFGKVQFAIRDADSTRQKALAVLCDPNSEYRTAVEQLGRLPDDYRAVKEVVTGLTVARAEYEETRAALADFAVRYPHSLAPSPEAVATAWTGLTDEYRRLEAGLWPVALDAAGMGTLPDVVPVGRAAQAVRVHREQLRSFIRVPEGATPKQLEAALLWPNWTQPERIALLTRLDQASFATTEKALKNWPTKPSGQTPAAPPKCSTQVKRESERDLQRVTDLVALGNPKLDKRSWEPTIRDYGQKTRAVWRAALPQTAISDVKFGLDERGWSVDPDDLPATSRQGRNDTSANPELPAWRESERAFAAWLGEQRYSADAAALQKLKLKDYPQHEKAVRDYVTAMENASRDFRTWLP